MSAVLVLMDTKGLVEIENEPWARMSTYEEWEKFWDSISTKRHRDLQEDADGTCYVLMAVDTTKAPPAVVLRAKGSVRVKRLTGD